MFGKTNVSKNVKTLRCNWNDAMCEYFGNGNSEQAGFTFYHTITFLSKRFPSAIRGCTL